MWKEALSKTRKRVVEFDKRITQGRLYLLSRFASPRVFWHIQSMSDSPVIIGGCGRSGTTLLLSLLSAHPNLLAIPHETYVFCPGGYGSKKDTGEPFQITNLYAYLLDRDDLLSRSRWVEKSPKNVLFIDRLRKYFGKNLRFLHIVRDGRDVITSRHPTDPSQYHVPPSRWVNDVSAARRSEHWAEVMTVRYEDIVADYQSEMKKVLSFIGEEYVSEIDKYPETATLQKKQCVVQNS